MNPRLILTSGSQTAFSNLQGTTASIPENCHNIYNIVFTPQLCQSIEITLNLFLRWGLLF